jgi:hypothetical protein
MAMAFNPEAEVKALRLRVEGLERKIDSLEKTIRALPDVVAIAKRLDAAEKAIAGKKDAKTAEQANTKLIAQVQAMAMEQAKQSVIETRLSAVEAIAKAALRAK